MLFIDFSQRSMIEFSFNRFKLVEYKYKSIYWKNLWKKKLGSSSKTLFIINHVISICYLLISHKAPWPNFLSIDLNLFNISMRVNIEKVFWKKNWGQYQKSFYSNHVISIYYLLISHKAPWSNFLYIDLNLFNISMRVNTEKIF